MVLISDALGLYVSPNCVLAGHGNQAVLYSANKKVKLPTGLRKGKVHGFASSPINHLQDLLLIFSENEYSLILHSPRNEKDQFKLIYEGETKDWINAAKFLDDNADNADKKTFVLHMAHSALLYLEVDLKSNADCRPLELARCSESSILYCTSLHGNRFGDLAIISGNAFGELLVWQTQNGIASGPAGVPVKNYPLLLRLPAHNGVIFSIDFDMASQLLVTTSDDRSVKFWRIQNWENWKKAEIKPMFSCFGHSSRVMCAVVFEAGGQAYVASGGEDSYVCVWNLRGDLLLKRRQHFGAPIWRLGFKKDDNTLYSTSSSGNLAAQDLQELLSGHKEAAACMLSDLEASGGGDFMRNVKFLNDQLIVGLSSLNQLYYMRVSEDSWHLVDPDFPTYKRTVLEVSGEVIATCGHRRITIYKYKADLNSFEQVFDGERLTGTIRSFHILSKDLYLASDDLGNCLTLRAHDLSIDSQIELGKYKEAWVTAALLISNNYLLLGDRRGHVMLYSRQSSADTFILKASLKYLHGKMGTNFFKLLHVADTADTAHVLSGGHEPLLKYLHLRLAEECTLTIGQRESVPLSWVEACPRGDLLLGFNDNHIVAWSRQHDVLVQLACGGGHRCWDYRLTLTDAGEDVLGILFIKKKRVFFYRKPLYHGIARDMAKMELNSWHTRNCNALRLLGGHDKAPPLIVSAGDDNIIKVTKVIDDTLVQCAEVHSHVSTVRCLQAHRLSSTTWLIFSAGGRSRLCINQLEVSKDNSKCLVTELATHVLQKSSTVQARLMAIDIVQEEDGEEQGHFSLYVAVADGEIRHYHWHLNKPSELHLQTFVDIKRCPLTLQWVKGKAIVLITTTSGEMYGFDRTLATKCLQLRLHMTGINTIDTCMDAKEEQRLHILSGGDDENIKYTVLDLDTMAVAYSKAFLGLHNAQVNGLSIHCSAKEADPMKGDSEAEMFAFTCGIDKQIYRIDLRTHQYRRVGYTSIADIKGMLVDEHHRRMYFYGSGFQIVEM